MTFEELLLRRLCGQHLLNAASVRTVVQDLCGVQAQFLTHALHSLLIRTGITCTDGLVKNWTIRGTMHLFSADDLPLFLHNGRTRFLRPVDTMESDAYVAKYRKAYFADLLLDSIAKGIESREDLKTVCLEKGMSEAESKSLFDPWGGLVRALCESGRIVHKVQEKKAYELCPPFEPMEQEPAELEMARRYFTHFGPATVKDAAYFFGTTQTKVKTWLEKLPVISTRLKDKTYFYIDMPILSTEMPRCLFLAGFDQLMLGYDKKESLHIPKSHTREIFNLAGIVRPAILINGTVAGWWNMKNQKLKINKFSNTNNDIIEEAAHKLWPGIQEVVFQ